jgi:hypothetical protein
MICGLCSLLLLENKTRSTTHNSRELNPPNQTRMRIEGTYILTTLATIEDSTFLAQIILTPDDDHIGRNI